MREEGAGRSGEHTGERGGPFSRSAGTTTHLHEGLHHAEGRGTRRREGKGKGAGLERKREIQSTGEGGERKINEKQE